MPENTGKSIKVGVVGCGSVAQIIHLPILHKHHAAQVVAVCDIDLRKATLVANRFGVPFVYDDIEDMLKRHPLDAVFILTPNNMHLPMSLIALNHGVEVFIEKPAARSGPEARQIAELARKQNRRVMVGMQNRFRRDVWMIKQFLDRHGLGDIFFMKSEWLQGRIISMKQPWWLSKRISGGGVLLDLGIQLIDAGWWLLNKPQPISAQAHVQQINTDIEVEDFCSFYLKFEGNFEMACHISWSFPIESDRFQAEIFGSGGSARLNPLQVKRLWQGKFHDLTPSVQDSNRRIFRRAYESEINHFLDVLRGKEQHLISTIDEAVMVLEMIDALYQSLQHEQVIHLKQNPMPKHGEKIAK
ncbi:MAG: gfo/Idh/MocA family oxidoreductase [Calditrichaeota bacterium]|nr:MAG: gfo/Idh/MocA family oxidoreductase [Calditrichota bacterium]